MEVEAGIANVIMTPDLYARGRLLVTHSKFLLVEGVRRLWEEKSIIAPVCSMA